ncbi:methyltransferase domain-containing protein [Thalassospira alkalitolerans]|nr:methyltransferase domain-containing protein [Thalassospira alkalitolerans]
MKNKCLCCGGFSVGDLVDFGPQPPSNRFKKSSTAETDTHPLSVGQCYACGMIQLVNPMPADMVRSEFDWITYNEPEGHLDDVVRRLSELPNLNKDSRIIGLTYKDDTTLKRLNDLGFCNVYRYDAVNDLGLLSPYSGLESIQAAFNSQNNLRLKEKHGLADLLSVRHILEHSHNPQLFISEIRKLVKPNGYIWFEMPDSSKFIKASDYVFIWEEHITYFTSYMMDVFAKNSDIYLNDIIIYPYQFEDSLVAIAENSQWVEKKWPLLLDADLDQALADGDKFAKQFSDCARSVRGVLEQWKIQGKKVAVFGAGHLAAKFLNMYSVGEFVTWVIDDHPSKQGLLMPGSGVPIIDSSVLTETDVCLLSLNYESERKVRAKNEDYINRGGEFMSIFVDNEGSIISEARNEF